MALSAVRTRAVNPLDIYRKGKRIAGKLAAAGRIQDSDLIVNTIRAGFTSTEICMALRHRLRKILAGRAVSEDLRQEIESLIGDIEQSLEMPE